MSNTTPSDTRHTHGTGSSSFDDGLEHQHHWARERSAVQQSGPIADARFATTPSTAVHDDAIYAV